MTTEKLRWERTTLKKSLDAVAERAELENAAGLERLYTPGDVADLDAARDLGFPGEPPFVRGVQPTMYRARFWTMRQYAGFSTAVETNRRFKYLLEAGQTGLSTAFDLPTQIGLDSDDPLAAGEVGRVGVSINSLTDMDELFAGIPLGEVSTSMTINSTAIVLLAMYVALARRRGVPLSKLSGTLQNDILKEYISRGTYAFPVEPSLRLVTDVFGYCVKSLPKWNPISISGYHIREAGSTAAQELAFTFADGVTYVEQAREAGQDLRRLLPRLSFFFNVHNNFLEEIAKFRAARRIWFRIVRDRFGLADESCQKLRFHTQTAGSTLTAQEPGNNVARVAIQALAAVLGGTQSLHTNSRDEALGLPTEASAQIALRTQQIIACETGVADTIDPLAGSYAIEALTARLEREVFDTLATIDAMGGMKAAIGSGYVQRQIQDSAWQAQQAVESGRQAIVGVNRFVSPSPATVPIQRIDPEIERRQCERLALLRSRRDASAARDSLARIEAIARSRDSLVEPIVEAVERDVTLGEIMTALRRVFGEHLEDKNF
ncbi:MAG: methylmalonyl-CoA mutase [Candidatus Wallbacteria bacterium]|nr:methylmalonyl-CoA mutase [Candidatus Wallbacteria bacterium]